MKLNLHVDEIKMIKIKGRHYPVTISGKGTPCLVVGNGIIVQRTLSSRFKEEFKVYATDLYWDRKYSLSNPRSLTFQNILEDIVEINNFLGLKQPIVFGFSAYGIVALELAKHYHDLARGLLLWWARQ